MPVITRSTAPVFELENATITGITSPSRGASDTATWRVQFNDGSESPPHSLTREETFLVLSGSLTVRYADSGTEERADAGDALIVPPGQRFSLVADGGPAEAICVFPIGGEAITEDGQFTPPWAR